MRSIHGLAARAAILISGFGLAGCATTSLTLERVMRQGPSGYVVVGSGEAAGFVTVFRGGQPLSARPPLALQTGDEIETGAGGAALIQYPNGSMVVIDANSRVRIGSLEVLFGRVFAAVRGLFSVESENVVAGVEGTEFLFEAGADKSVHVVVLDGRVTCSSKTGRWRPTPLRAGEGFVTVPGGLPSVHPASQSELDSISAWVRRVVNPSRPGYPPDALGWCCERDRVKPTPRSLCRGAFYADEVSAQRACAPPPEPSDWCCDDGEVASTPRSRCGGRYYADRASAERACAPPPEPRGWCCDDGQVTPGPRSQCRGTFYTDQRTAVKACAQQKVGWCCLPDYKVSQMNATTCRANRGTYYPDERTARNACVQIQ